MCWSVPGRIVDIEEQKARVDISGVERDIALDLITDPKVGDYVLIHAGYAIQKVDEEQAKFTIEFFKGAQGNV
ncbi:MAG: HypC/HybG/HupF family hydrogenase formation chaperone [Candidatus Tantalella remota]|nr:HypC/HybG/HupF family hydrogenase formation chaperone [Candidatus Tantalella remota]